MRLSRPAAIRLIFIFSTALFSLLALGCLAAEVGDEAKIVQALEDMGVDSCPVGYNVIEGTEGDDVIEGTCKRDCIVAYGGNDIIRAGNGNDIVLAGPGDETGSIPATAATRCSAARATIRSWSATVATAT